MAWHYTQPLTTIETHTAGMPTRIVVGGLPQLAGASVAEQRADARANHDQLRAFLCNEPRGHGAMYAAYIVPSQVADVGVIFASQVGYDDMCGHGTIGVVTALLESGRLGPRGQRSVRLETPAGLVEATARWADQRVTRVTFDSVAAFVHRRGVEVDVRGAGVPGLDDLGVVRGDIAFGGNWYLYVDVAAWQRRIVAADAHFWLAAGAAIKAAANAGDRLLHPANAAVADRLLGVSFYASETPDAAAAPASGDAGGGGGGGGGGRALHQANVVVESATFFDRSPCGTGTCGRLALLHAAGQLQPGDELCNRSITGGVFTGTITGTTELGGVTAVLPRLSGSASASGTAEWTLAPDDPLGTAGFRFG